MRKPSVHVCTPSYDGTVTVPYLLTILEAQKDVNLQCHFRTGSLLTRSRNKLMVEALQREAEYILLLDADVHVTTPGWLGAMISVMEANTADVLGGIVALKGDKQQSNLAVGKKGFDASCLTFDEIQTLPDVFPVDMIGAGCILIKVGDWLKNMEKPWFHIEDGFDGEVRVLSEDWYFCRKARANGARILAWKGLSTEHYGVNKWSFIGSGGQN